jgi:hypothetical protein
MKTQHILAPKEILSTRLFEGENDVLSKELETPTNNRKSAWIEFFNENQTNPFCFHSESFLAVLMFFEGDNLIKEQTGFEFEMSKAFYCELFSLKRQMVLSNAVTAQKLLMLSLIFGKYHGMFRCSISNYFTRCGRIIIENTIDQLFIEALIRYEVPFYFVKNFHKLNSVELDVLMQALSGRNMRNHTIFNVRPTKKEFSALMKLENSFLVIKDHSFIRGLIYIKLNVGFEDDVTGEIDTNESAMISTYMLSSRTYENNPQKYLDDILFWKRGFELIVEGIHDHLILSISDCVDYLEHMKYQSNTNYSLIGRTSDSLIRAIHHWHNHVYMEEHSNLKELKWDKSDELELYFRIGLNEFSCMQLNTGKELSDEGRIMKNCVISYAISCANLNCTIWSLRIKRKEVFTPIMTIEVINKTIVQARTKANGLPNEKQLDILHNWAMRMEYTINLYKND